MASAAPKGPKIWKPVAALNQRGGFQPTVAITPASEAAMVTNQELPKTRTPRPAMPTRRPFAKMMGAID
jgi:hypothetical protein